MAIERPQLILADDPALPAYPIEQGETRVGRASSNQINVRHRSISRHHFSLERTGDEIRIVPCGKNVTRIDDQLAVSGQLLRDGQTIQVGARELIFRFPGQPAIVERAPIVPPPPSPSRRNTPAPKPASNRLLPPDAKPTSQRTPAASRRRRRASYMPVAASLLVLIGVAVLATLAVVGMGRQDNAAQMAEQQAELAALIQQLKDKDGEFSAKDRELTRIQADLTRQQTLLADLRTTLAARKQAGVDEQALEAAQSQKLADAEIALRQLTLDRDRVAAERKQLKQARDQLAAKARKQAPVKQVQTESKAPEEERITRGRSVDMTGTKQAARVLRNTLSRKDRGDLVKQLCATLDDYANPDQGPGSLEPRLTRLASLTGKEAAVDMITVYKHARSLLKDLDRNLKFLDKRETGMNRAAEGAAAQRDRAGDKGNKGNRGRRRGRREQASKKDHNAELNQRLLEMYERKIKIKEAQRDRLVALRDHVCKAFRKLTADPQTRYLVGRFKNESDPVQRMAILGAIQASKPRHAVPALISKLSLRDAELKASIQQTLTEITGVDKGAKKKDWQAWWKENKDL